MAKRRRDVGAAVLESLSDAGKTGDITELAGNARELLLRAADRMLDSRSVCASCGRRTDPSRSFCLSCGSSVFVSRKEWSDTPSPGPSTPPRPGLVIAPLIRLIVFGAIAWYVASMLMGMAEVRAVIDALKRGERVNFSPAIDTVRGWIDERARDAPAATRRVLPPSAAGSQEQPLPPVQEERYALAYKPGNGVSQPRPIFRARPRYTPRALREQIEGSVFVLGIVQPDGSFTDVSLVRSLDALDGLDAEALDAARKWRFAPGRRNGESVPVLMQIEITFSLR